jgi:hypothetical protein
VADADTAGPAASTCGWPTPPAGIVQSSPGACRRMSPSNCRSHGLGSIPSSSPSIRRADWNTPSASACRPERYNASIHSPCRRSRNG